MTLASPCAHNLLLVRLFQKLKERGWPLGRDIPGEKPAVLLERVLEKVLNGGLPDGCPNTHPLPDWFLGVFMDADHDIAGQSPRTLIESYLHFPETCLDILDSMVLWLDCDACVAAGPEGLFHHLKTRQYDLQANTFYTHLTQQDYVFKLDNFQLRRRATPDTLPLSHLLQFLGAFSCENLASRGIRDAVCEQLRARYKTNVIPDAFLAFLETVQDNPFFSHVIVVSGFFTLFFSLHDHVAGLRRTGADIDIPDPRDDNSVGRMIDCLRHGFAKGVVHHSPATHFRYSGIDHQDFIRKIALHFWQHKLKQARQHEELLQPKRGAEARCSGTQGLPAMDYHSRMILRRILPDTSAGLQFLTPESLHQPCITCRILRLREPHLVLAVNAADPAVGQISTDAAFMIRFSIETRGRSGKYYACQCKVDHLEMAMESQTIIVARPESAVVSMERRHPRVAPGLLPLKEVNIRLGLKAFPEHDDELASLGTPRLVWPVLKGPIVLMNISASGACIDVFCPSARKWFQGQRSAIGLAQIVLETEGESAPMDTLLTFQFRSQTEENGVFRSGVEFVAEGKRSFSGKLRWRAISENGCMELGGLIVRSMFRLRGRSLLK